MRRKSAPTTLERTELPAFLASGPCVEDWSRSGKVEDWFYAWRRWQAAMRAWGAEHGYDAPGLPLGPVESLARTRRVWSRAYLHESGRGALSDFYDGLRADRPAFTGRWRSDLWPSADETAA